MNLEALNQAITSGPAKVSPNLAKIAAVLSSNQPSQNNSSVVYPNNGNQVRNSMNQLCADLKAERNKQGLTQRDLAAKCGMSQGTMTRAERHGWISIWALIRIADALGKKITLT